MDLDDYTQTVGSVISAEHAGTYGIPLDADDYRDLFEKWCAANERALHDIELTALSIDARGLRVSTKYLIEKQRYEGRMRLVGIPYTDQFGEEHVYSINNTVTPLLARWLLSRHPDMRIECRKSMFDDKESK